MINSWLWLWFRMQRQVRPSSNVLALEPLVRLRLWALFACIWGAKQEGCLSSESESLCFLYTSGSVCNVDRR